jgi:4-diphosphocytidyl-2-C-methyl-D-erythritol kinase
MISISIKAPAKLNLFLLVLDKRQDGFHDIATLFERIDLFDRITLKRRKDDKITVSCDSPQVPRGNNNIVYKAVDLLRKRFLIREGLDISIEKNIPVAAGLGGGSSDAAAVLLALNKLWQLKLDKNDLLKIAGKIGADVPFFITGSRFSLSLQPQQSFKPINTGLRLWHILVTPKVSLSTKRVFEQFDRLKQPGFKPVLGRTLAPNLTLTRKGKNVNMFTPLKKVPGEKNSLTGLTRLLAKSGKIRGYGLAIRVHFNSLEPAADVLTPQINKIKKELLRLGAESVGMSGSGPSVFATLKSRKEGERFQKRLSRFKGWRTFIARTF